MFISIRRPQASTRRFCRKARYNIHIQDIWTCNPNKIGGFSSLDWSKCHFYNIYSFFWRWTLLTFYSSRLTFSTYILLIPILKVQYKICSLQMHLALPKLINIAQGVGGRKTHKTINQKLVNAQWGFNKKNQI